MNVQDIISMWDQDCKINETELGLESLKTSKLHNKYLKLFMSEKILNVKVRAEYKKVRRKLTEYYLGELDDKELKEYGRVQFFKKLLKSEVEIYIESDDEYIDVVTRLSIQDEKIDYVLSILKAINTRGFAIKNAIDWEKLTQGI